MRQFQTYVVDFKFVYEGDFTSEPFECGWASEAIFFVRIEERDGEKPALSVRAQISADGLHWVDHAAHSGPLTERGDYSLGVTHFGGFIRLRGEISGRQPRFQLTNNLVLKE